MIALGINSPWALAKAAVESCAVGAQNVKRENCFASLPWIALSYVL
jgi:hypothetical protein